jgi:hypothetical protein
MGSKQRRVEKEDEGQKESHEERALMINRLLCPNSVQWVYSSAFSSIEIFRASSG